MIFTGNGYSAEWPVEAQKRGLPNLNTTPKAVATWNSDKNKSLSSKLSQSTCAYIYIHQYYCMYDKWMTCRSLFDDVIGDPVLSGSSSRA